MTILYVIETDETIEGERKERFREYLGMYKDELLQQTAFNAPDFFARVLLYTTWVANKEGFPYAEKITNAFIEETVKNSWAELKWDATTQTVEIIPTEEQRLHDEIMRLSEFRHSVISEPMLYTDLSWMGIDERDLFPNRHHIEFKDHKTKTEVLKKLSQYVKLLNEFVCCLVSMRQSALGQAANWPIFPDEKMRDIRQELENLSDELFTLGLFGERFFIE